MNTVEMLNVQTQYGLMGDCHSVYRGPARDRLSLRAAHAAGMLIFSVNRSHISCKIGEPTIHGYWEDFGDAVKALNDLYQQTGEVWRISAHHRGFGHTEECLIYCNYWKPLGELVPR